MRTAIGLAPSYGPILNISTHLSYRRKNMYCANFSTPLGWRLRKKFQRAGMVPACKMRQTVEGSQTRGRLTALTESEIRALPSVLTC